jgi:hypothetical protein
MSTGRFNMEYRPDTYWPASKVRRSRASAAKLKDSQMSLGRVHPRALGGAFLPHAESGEVEIARVSLASTTGDIISVRAQQTNDGILYSVVDEYADEGHAFEPGITQSALPLTLAELIQLINETEWKHEKGIFGLTTAFLDWQVDAMSTE